MSKATVYVHPGNSQCNVYWMPYAMKPGQQPGDIHERYRAEWKQVALLNHDLQLVWVDKTAPGMTEEVIADLAGSMGGTFFEIDVPAPAA